MASDLRLLQSVDVRLEQAGFTVLVCGGWAEELPGLVAPRAHHDIDLLLLDPDPAVLDEFLGASVEIPEKCSSQKPAIEVDGTLVELSLAHREAGEYLTWLWDQLRWGWPVDPPVTVAGARLASRVALASYRGSWAVIQAARPTPT